MPVELEFTPPIYRPPHRMESENGFAAQSVDRAAADERPGVSAPAAETRENLSYFALDLPHKGQASYVHIHEIVDNLRRLGHEVAIDDSRLAEVAEHFGALADEEGFARGARSSTRSPTSSSSSPAG